jgi:hypothetical protein
MLAILAQNDNLIPIPDMDAQLDSEVVLIFTLI